MITIQDYANGRDIEDISPGELNRFLHWNIALISLRDFAISGEPNVIFSPFSNTKLSWKMATHLLLNFPMGIVYGLKSLRGTSIKSNASIIAFMIGALVFILGTTVGMIVSVVAGIFSCLGVVFNQRQVIESVAEQGFLTAEMLEDKTRYFSLNRDYLFYCISILGGNGLIKFERFDTIYGSFNFTYVPREGLNLVDFVRRQILEECEEPNDNGTFNTEDAS